MPDVTTLPDDLRVERRRPNFRLPGESYYS